MKDFLRSVWLKTKFYWAVGKMYAGNYWTAHRGQILRVLAAINLVLLAVYFRHALHTGATIMFNWLMSHVSVLHWGIAFEALLLGVMLSCILAGMGQRFKPDLAEMRWLLNRKGRRLRLIYVHALWVFLPGALALGSLAAAEAVIPDFPHKGVLAMILWVIGAISTLGEAYAESVPHPRCTEEQLLVYPAPPPPPPAEEDDKGKDKKDKKKEEPPPPVPQDPRLVTISKEHMPMASMGLAQCDEDQVGFVTRFRGYAYTFSPTIDKEVDLPITGGLLATFWPFEMLDRRMAIPAIEFTSPEAEGKTIKIEPTAEEKHPWTMPFKKWINVPLPAQGITNASGQKVMVTPFIRYRIMQPELFRYGIGNFKQAVVAEAYGAIFKAIKPMTTDEMVVRKGKGKGKFSVEAAMKRMYEALDEALQVAAKKFGVEIEYTIEDFEIPDYAAAQTTFLLADAQARGVERLRKAGVHSSDAYNGQTFAAAVKAAQGSSLLFLQNPLDALNNVGRGGSARSFDDRGRGGRGDEETRGRPKKEKEPKKVDLDAETGTPATAGGTATTGDATTAAVPEGEEKVEEVL